MASLANPSHVAMSSGVDERRFNRDAGVFTLRRLEATMTRGQTESVCAGCGARTDGPVVMHVINCNYPVKPDYPDASVLQSTESGNDGMIQSFDHERPDYMAPCCASGCHLSATRRDLKTGEYRCEYHAGVRFALSERDALRERVATLESALRALYEAWPQEAGMPASAFIEQMKLEGLFHD